MSSFTEDVISFVSGAIAGCAQVFVMQPFEIIKLRQVNQEDGSEKYHGFRRSFKTILQEEGFLSFYKGTKSPLIGYGLQCSLQFGSNRYFRRLLADYNGGQTQTTLLLASVLTGIPSALTVTPADHIRIVMQKQTHGGTQNYKGQFEAVRDIYKRHGIRGLYLGFHITLVRQLLAMGLYFTSYHLIKHHMNTNNESSQAKKHFKVMLSGGLAGLFSWVVGYPIDFVKTKIQSQDLDEKKYKSSWDCFMRNYRKYGPRVFTRGLITVCLRSIPVNAVGFTVEEKVAGFMGRQPIE